MSAARGWLARFGGLFGKQARDRELSEEIRGHLEMHIADNLRAGMSAEEARRRAMVQLGGVEALKENYRERRSVPVIEHALQDVRYGVRMLVKNPGFTLAAIIALALGIGANTALFSVVYGVLLRPLPYAAGNRLIEVQQDAPQVGMSGSGFSVKEIADYRARTHTLDQVEEYHGMSFILLAPQPDRVKTGVVSAGFFSMLGVKPLLGRDFQPSDDEVGAVPVLILSNQYWKRAFGGDPNAVGKALKMNDKLHTVIGVLPPIPQYPRENDVYMPTVACPFRGSAHMREGRTMRMMRMFGRMKPGIPIESAGAEMHAILAAFHTDYPGDYKADDKLTVSVKGLRQQLTERARPMLLMLLGTTGLVLLICCTNVANLALARMVRREHEFSIRAALGASRARLMRQVLTESTMLAVAGGLLGLLLASFSMDLLVRFISRFTTRAGEVSMNPQVLLFTLAISVATGLLFGILPAFTAGRGEGALKMALSRSSAPTERQRMRAVLITAEVAVCFVLLSAAGLVIRSLIKLEIADAGFDAEKVVSMKLPYNFTKFGASDPDRVKLRNYEDEILRRLEALPGIDAVGMVSVLPLDQASGPLNTNFQIEGRAKRAGPQPQVNVATVSPGAFRALGIPLLRGRLISASDRSNKADTIVISQSMARHYWGTADPVGQRIKGDGDEWSTIVGVVGDVRLFGLDKDTPDTAYIPTWADPGNANVVVIRTNADAMNMAGLARKAIQSIDPEQPVVDVKTLLELRGESLLNTRVTAMLLSLFALVALVIAVTGLAGVTAFMVSQRTREIGIRLALGAQPGQVLAMVLAHGMKLIAIGAAVGLAASLATGRLMEQLLVGVKPVDWPNLATVAAVLIVAALAANYVPARRATKVDPLVALRYE